MNILGMTMLDRIHGFLVGGATGGTVSSFVQETNDGSLWSHQVPGTVNVLCVQSRSRMQTTVGLWATSAPFCRTTDNTSPELR